ncbi:hypothetical protein [Nocardia sp. NBC_01009]|uniref:hypothetical protein n=1 Tax=Nocardia sp. NBC_01009 TaxID=2975996 RepID=UPI00386D6002|nr:adenylosuccinate synthetase [Nocardia sp. NBC_01009]
MSQGHIIVVDLGFGDAGKGATIDWLCSPEAELGVAAAARRIRYGALHSTSPLAVSPVA